MRVRPAQFGVSWPSCVAVSRWRHPLSDVTESLTRNPVHLIESCCTGSLLCECTAAPPLRKRWMRTVERASMATVLRPKFPTSARRDSSNLVET
eukprot:335544-Pleurochrysis_carterae.AAC.2